jgi:radical SAM protein with 4Fe4S-binding SPASM domain
MNTERYKKITGHNKLDRIVNNIKHACENGVRIRIAMMMLDQTSVSDLDYMAEVMRNIGVYSLSPSYIVNLGKASKINPTQGDWTGINEQVMNKIADMKQKYGKFIQPELNEFSVQSYETRHNCGAGVRKLALAPDGKFRPCVLFPVDFGVDKEIVELPREAMQSIAQPTDKTCSHCDSINYCKGCILKATLKTREMSSACTWSQSVGKDIEAIWKK